MLDIIHLSHPLLPWEEYPKLTVFALHPGLIRTQMSEDAAGVDGFADGTVFDTVQLPAATMLYLTSGRVDWLNGKSVRYFPGHARSLQSHELRQIFGGQLGYCGDRERLEGEGANWEYAC
jgi:hypothetical protein